MKPNLLLAIALTLSTTVAAVAQDDAGYPRRSVKIVVNVAPGGGVDAAARIVAQKLGEKFGQTFVVENRGGGSGNIAAEAVYHSDPDGYTLLAAPGATISINDLLFKKLGYDPVKYESVAVLTSVPLALVVRPGFPAKSFQEFLAYTKANPGKLNYASNGIGTAAHLTAELFNLEFGAKMVACAVQGHKPGLERPRCRPRRSDLHPVFGVPRSAQGRARKDFGDCQCQADRSIAGCADPGRDRLSRSCLQHLERSGRATENATGGADQAQPRH